MRRKRSGSHLLTRKLGKIATNGAHVGSESIDIPRSHQAAKRSSLEP